MVIAFESYIAVYAGSKGNGGSWLPRENVVLRIAHPPSSLTIGLPANQKGTGSMANGGEQTQITCAETSSRTSLANVHATCSVKQRMVWPVMERQTNLRKYACRKHLLHKQTMSMSKNAKACPDQSGYGQPDVRQSTGIMRQGLILKQETNCGDVTWLFNICHLNFPMEHVKAMCLARQLVSRV